MNTQEFGVEGNVFEASWHIVPAAQVLRFGYLAYIVNVDLSVRSLTFEAFGGAEAELSWF